MRFKPHLCKSRWEGIFVTSWVLLIDILLFTWLLQRPIDGISFLLILGILISLPLLFHLSYRTWGAFNLEYWLDRDAVHIRWAATHQIIPLNAIQCIVQGGDSTGRMGFFSWPAPFVRSENRKTYRLERFATCPLPDCLLLETAEATFAISPIHFEYFLEAIRDYNQLGPIQVGQVERKHSLASAGWILDNTGAWLIGAGAVGTLFLFGLLMIQYPHLPEMLVFHYNVDGVPDSIRPKSALFLLPMIGLLAFLFNGLSGVWMVFRQQRVGAYLLWGGTLPVQLLVLLALFSLIG
jgi:hypothetical protein